MNEDQKVSLLAITLSLIAAFWIGMASYFKSFFNGVGAALVAFDSMLSSFGNFLIQTGKLILIGSVTIGIATLAIYMTIKFLMLVKNSTDLMERFEAQSQQVLCELKVRQDELERKVGSHVRFLEDKLDALLAPPELGPKENKEPVEEKVTEVVPTANLEAEVSNKY